MPKKAVAVEAAIQARLELRRWARRLAQKAGKAQRNRARSGGRAPRIFRGQTPAKAPAVEIEVPQTLDLASRHVLTCGFVDAVRATVRAGNRAVLLFHAVKTIRPSALMYLVSQIHKLHLEYGRNCVTGTYPESVRIERLLAESGFFKLLGVRTRARVAQRSPSRRYIQFKSDIGLEKTRIREVREEILQDDFLMPVPVRNKIFRAISEAATNVGHHAYVSKSFKDAAVARHLHGRWWLLASLNRPANRFTLVFSDTGVGIPKTLPRKYPIEQVRKALSLFSASKVDDGQMIEAAMVLGRTRTKLDNRGKGLLDLTQLIDIVGGGEMNIYSRQGMVKYTPGQTTHDNSLGSLEGTLIEWMMPLDKALVANSPETYDEAESDH